MRGDIPSLFRSLFHLQNKQHPLNSANIQEVPSYATDISDGSHENRKKKSLEAAERADVKGEAASQHGPRPRKSRIPFVRKFFRRTEENT
jgi:hypothetical protein